MFLAVLSLVIGVALVVYAIAHNGHDALPLIIGGILVIAGSLAFLPRGTRRL